MSSASSGIKTASSTGRAPLQALGLPPFVAIVLAATVVFYATFVVLPIGMSAVGSLYRWNPLRGRFDFTGVSNYVRAYSEPVFWTSMVNNVIFTVAVVTGRTGLGLGIALLMQRVRRGRSLFRTIYFVPVVTSMVAVALIWNWMYDPQVGLINQVIRLLGGSGRAWLKSADTALGAIAAMTVWKETGYAVVIYLAGLLAIPPSLYEAADIDGATRRQTFLHITLPLLRPTTLFIVVTSLISYMQTFVQIFVMTEGGPGTATYLTTYMIYEEAFVKFNFGYASSIAFNLFLVIMALTWVQFKLIRERT
jgi:multiple sugar transport system permease protein